MGPGRTSCYFTPPALSLTPLYYWQIVPTNPTGNASSCPIWSFTTSPVGGVQIGNEDIDYNDLPIYPEYSYSYSQTLYLQSEINITDKSISKIYYQWSGGTGGDKCKDWVVYMGHTSKTSFTNEADWVPFDDLIEVFNGEVTLPEEPGWIEIWLDYPFPYNNADNLVIAVDENTDDWESGIYFYGSETPVNRGLLLYDDYSNPDPASSASADDIIAGIANIRLLFEDEPACPVPHSLAFANVTDVSAELSWTSEQEFFDVEVIPANQSPTGIPTATNVTTPYVVSGLFSATNYRFYVRANCDANGYSNWRESGIFTTNMCDLENRCNYYVNLSDQAGDGWNGTTIDFVQNGYVVETAGPNFLEGSTYGPVYIPVCSGIQTDLVVANTGNNPQDVKLQLFDTYGALIYTLDFGSTLTEGDILFTFTSACYFADDDYIGLTDSYWSNPNNWASGVVPGYNTSVNILSPKNVIVDLPDAICRKLTIQNGGRITIDPGMSLTVLNKLTNLGDEPGLIIRSDASGTGSLMHPDYGVKATFQRYLEAADWENSEDGWHYISSPVNNAPIAYEWTPSEAGDGYDFYLWNSGTATWLNQKDPDNDITFFERAVGYCVAYQQTKTQAFSGELFIGDHSSNIPITVNSWIPLGNPYPCALRWNTSYYMLDGYADIAKVWNRQNKSYDDILPYDIIPATNGFMAFGQSIGTLVNLQMNIPSNARIISTTPFYKSGSIKKGIFLNVRDTEGYSIQKSFIIENENATNIFSLKCDSKFLSGYAPQFYSIKSGEQLSTYAVDDITRGHEIHFGFEKNQSDNFELVFEKGKSIATPAVYVTDLKTGTTQNLSQQPVYTFTSTNVDNPDRFVISFGNVGNDDTNDTVTTPRIWHSGNELFVQSTNDYQLIEVFDIQGRLLIRQNFEATDIQIIRLNQPNGIYFVKLSGKHGVFNHKIILCK